VSIERTCLKKSVTWRLNTELVQQCRLLRRFFHPKFQGAYGCRPRFEHQFIAFNPQGLEPAKPYFMHRANEASLQW